MAADIKVIWVGREGEYFCERGWTPKSPDSLSGKSHRLDSSRTSRWVRKVPTCDIRYACFRFGADPILERRNSGIAVSSG
jgi:hypothetical protein